MKIISYSFILTSLIALTACSGLPDLSDSDTTNNNTTSSQNCQSPPVYKAQGKSYKALKNATGYQAKGQATLYNENQLGKSTPICETISLEGFTAAHRTLPLPTFVKITNTNNKKSVVIKVNDRGPSNASSLIQVTPAVANLLEVTGKAFPVHIEALSKQNTRSSTDSVNTKKATARPLPLNNQTRNKGDRYYIVLGTYPDQAEAFEKFVRVSSIGLPKATIESRKKRNTLLHMVRLGPFYKQDEIDHIKDRLKNDGLVNFKVVRN